MQGRCFRGEMDGSQDVGWRVGVSERKRRRKVVEEVVTKNKMERMKRMEKEMEDKIRVGRREGRWQVAGGWDGLMDRQSGSVQANGAAQRWRTHG